MPMRISGFPVSICFEFAVAADQRIHQTIVSRLVLGSAVEFRDDAQGQHFAELHAPLVKRVDVPRGCPWRGNPVETAREPLAGYRRSYARPCPLIHPVEASALFTI